MKAPVDESTIRITMLNGDGSAPGADVRVGFNGGSRKSFQVLQDWKHAHYTNATVDVVLAPGLTLNSFDTFTIWCYEFNVVLAEGKFVRP